MTIPTNQQILDLLDRLDQGIADDLESETLEIKPWRGARDDLRVAVEYAACFANAGGGVVVFGIADKTRGRGAAIHGAGKLDLDRWQRDIFETTRPNLKVTVEELAVPEGTGKLLLVRVPRGPNRPYGTAQGLYKHRVGKHCMPLDPSTYFHGEYLEGNVDWSARPAPDVSPDDLDPLEIVRARKVLTRYEPKSDLLKLDDNALLLALGAIEDGRVTNAGLLLFGRESVLTSRCPNHKTHYVYQVSDVDVTRNDFHRGPLLETLEAIERNFEGPINPEEELLIGFGMMRIPAFPLDVIREAWLNAVTHRDYLDIGEVFVRHKQREVEIISPGRFPGDITPENILRHGAIQRNGRLAEAFQKLRLVEKSGVGRLRMFWPMLEYGKALPVYQTNVSQVILKFFNGNADTAMAKLVAQFKKEDRALDFDGLLVLYHLRRNDSIDVDAASALLQLDATETGAILSRLAQPEPGLLERDRETEVAVYRLRREIQTMLADEENRREWKSRRPKRRHLPGAKSFAERVVDVFEILGYEPTSDLTTAGLDFDLGLRMRGPIESFALVQCHASRNPVPDHQVREFIARVRKARLAHSRDYHAIIVAASEFGAAAVEVAATEGVRLLTFRQLLHALEDFDDDEDRDHQRRQRSHPLQDVK